MKQIKLFSKIMLSLALMFAVAVPAMNKVNAATTYDVIYRAGAHGTISGESKVVINQAYGTDTTKLSANDIDVDDGYVFKGWNKEIPDTVTGRMTFVAKYARVVDGVDYRVRYVDQNDVDIITPQLALGENGSSVTAYAKAINNWPVDQSSKSIVLKDGSTNEIKFVYTVPEDEVQTEYITEYVTVGGATVATGAGTGGTGTAATGGAGTTGAGAGAGTTAGDEATTDIEDNEVAQAGDQSTEDIKDNKVAQSGAKDESNNAVYLAGGAGAVVLIAIVAYLLSKRKKVG